MNKNGVPTRSSGSYWFFGQALSHPSIEASRNQFTVVLNTERQGVRRRSESIKAVTLTILTFLHHTHTTYS